MVVASERLHDRVIYEVVIDLAAPRARLAYLRDVTWLGAATQIAASIEVDEDVEGIDEDIDEDVDRDADTEQDTELEVASDADPVEQEQPEPVEAVSLERAAKRIGRWTAG